MQFTPNGHSSDRSDPTDPRALLAAHDNAAWCHAVSRAHGATCRFEPGLWVNPGAAPTFYPNIVTLDPAARDLNQRIAALMRQPGWPAACGVKDSFARLDLTPLAFDALFDATWLHRPAGRFSPAGAATLRWQPARDRAALVAWAWASARASASDCTSGESRATLAQAIFVPPLLDDAGVLLWAGLNVDAHIVCGVATSIASGHALGLSNLFATGAAPADWRAQCLSMLTAQHPGLPIVGYEHGDDLKALLVLGFDAVGPLRVWVRSGVRSGVGAGVGAAVPTSGS